MNPQLTDDMVEGMDDTTDLHLVHKPAARNSAFYWNTGEPSIFASLALSDTLSKASTAKVKSDRENGTDRSTFRGISKKADAQIAQRAAPHGGAYAKAVSSSKEHSKTARLREALRAGAMGSGDLSRATGIDAGVIPALLKFDVDAGRVRRLREYRPMRYQLVGA